MKVLLIKAPYMDVYGPIKLAAGNYFLLGLGYIASYLRKYGHEVFMLDPEAQRLDREEYKRRIRKINPDLVGISATTPDFDSALKIAELVRSETDAFILLGGIHASSLPEYILTKYNETFDAVCIGEGEETTLEICKFINGEIKSLGEIKGISFNDNRKIVKTEPRPFMQDLDSLPFPARDLINIDLYQPHAFNTRKGRTATLITSRGCPFRCTFCASKLTLGGKFRARGAENVVAEIERLVKDHGVNHILIQDDTFTYDLDRAREVCRRIIKKKLSIEWFCFSQVTKVDDELLGLMKRAGCYSIGYGIESVDKNVLKLLRKPINAEISERAIKLAKKHRLKTQAFFIFGNNGDTKETIKETIDFACRTSPTLAFFNKLVAYPGTEIFIKRFGTDYENIEWKNFVPMGVGATVSDSSTLTKEELHRLAYKANLRFYARPSQWWEIIKSIRSFHELKAYSKAGIGLLLQMLEWHKKKR